ncbi:hypothetical protein FM106_21120 [Brachybacterium faecium]|nr:hypothetical protein FM106_21120 [Brachybacterium faecium]
MNSMIDDFQLAVDGKNRMAWFRESMPIITRVNELLKKKQTFAGKKLLFVCTLSLKQLIG